MKGKKWLYFIVTLIILAGVFNLLAFLIPFERTTSFWIGYGFAMGAIVVSFLTSFIVFRGNLKSKLYGVPMVRLAWIYLCVQTVLGFVFMAFSSISYKIPLIVCILVLAFYLIGLMGADMTKAYAEDVEKKVKVKTFFIKSLQLELSEISSSITDNDLAGAFKELADDVRYSDPMSSDQLADVETNISYQVSELRNWIGTGRKEEAIAAVGEIRKLIALRNQKCKLLK